MSNTRCSVEESLTEELLNKTSLGESFAADAIKEAHLKECSHPKCQEIYKVREELDLNNQTLEEYAKDWSNEE